MTTPLKFTAGMAALLTIHATKSGAIIQDAQDASQDTFLAALEGRSFQSDYAMGFAFKKAWKARIKAARRASILSARATFASTPPSSGLMVDFHDALEAFRGPDRQALELLLLHDDLESAIQALDPPAANRNAALRQLSRLRVQLRDSLNAYREDL